MATFRTIIQISTGQFQRTRDAPADMAVIALCDDGTVWESLDFGEWRKWDVSAITQADGAERE